MLVNIISNISNGAGLQRDYYLIRSFLEERGHVVNGVMFDGAVAPKVDLNIFLEVVTPSFLDRASENWMIPNAEWWYSDLWNQYIPKFSKVLCKTKDCERIWKRKIGNRAQFIGFESLDLYEPSIERKPTFVHMAGKSETKNTAAVMEAWRRYELPPLTVVAYKPNIAASCKNVRNVTHIDRVSEEDLRKLMNENLFHIMPSKYEGFGHYIHEAIGCGGLVLTTNARPMNEFNGIAPELLIKPSHTVRMRDADAWMVSSDAVAQTVKRAAELSPERVKVISRAARAAFLSDREDFRKTFGQLA